MDPVSYFSSPSHVLHTQYEALRAFFIDKIPAQIVARTFGYTISAFYSLIRDFKRKIASPDFQEPFFISRSPGRRPLDTSGELATRIIALRKQYLSVPDIKATLDVQGFACSEKYVYSVIKNDGFARLPRRPRAVKAASAGALSVHAPQTSMLRFDTPESFASVNALGVLCLAPYLHAYGIDTLIRQSPYPATSSLDTLSSILSFVALKLSNVSRYTADDVWCMDRGLGFFAGLNVLPKAAWCTSYSHRVSRSMNRSFLMGLHALWRQHGLLSDTANIDFTTIPYWGNASHLENNWSGTRHKAMASMLAVLAQDPDTGILTYGDTSIRHDRKSDVVLEFLDFYRSAGTHDLAYLVFDSKFTCYENLARLDPDVKFITIRRRGTRLVEELDRLPRSAWKQVRVPAADGKGRTVYGHDARIFLKGYGKQIRQIALSGHGRTRPALILTNDFDRPLPTIIHTYAKRWLVEKEISEQIEFFHLNRLSSSVVIKVDFDLTMSILAHNLLRLFALDLPGYAHCSAHTLFNKFLLNGGSVQITPDQVLVRLNKKRTLPLLLTAMERFRGIPIPIWGNRTASFLGDSRS